MNEPTRRRPGPGRLTALAAAAFLLAGGLGPAAPAGAADDDPGRFTASPERRAALLEAAREKDRQREAEKAKAPTLTIVADGAPAATIVVDDRVEPAPMARGKISDRAAANVLQAWIELMSGAKLPIAGTAPAKGPAIYVGRAALGAGATIDDVESPTREAIRVACDGEHVYLAAGRPAAAMRAVGRFLEEEFGCRWVSDRPWGRVYPEAKTLKVRVRSFSEAPTWRYRRIWGAEGAFGHAPWLYWSGHGGESFPMSHSWAGVLPENAFEAHPEWFRMNEAGERVPGHWYNLGHPEVRERFIAWALEASDNGKKHLSLSPPDDHRVDHSPEAKKYDKPVEIEPSTGRVSMTNRFMGLVNEAAKRAWAKNRDGVFSFYAYSDYTLPPTSPDLDELSPNLAIWIAPIRYSRYHPLGHPHSESRQLLKRIVDGWAKRAAMLGWRTYNTNLAEIMVPFSKLSVWAHDLPYLQERGCIGVNLESVNTWELYAPHLYLSIRLAYDPTQDPWAIMADYWHKAYGPAAGPMQDYWMTIDRAFVNLESESGSYHALHRVYTPGRIEALDGYLDAAEAAAADAPGCAKRVHLARRGFRRARYWRAWYEAINRGDIDAARETYEAWRAFVLESIANRDSNVYADRYLRRFIGNHTMRAWRFVHPEAAEPGRVAAVLPDKWKYRTGAALEKAGVEADPFDPALDDTGWPTVRTFTATLNEQGYPEYFGPMWYRTAWEAPATSGPVSLCFVKADRKVTLYVNGRQVGEAGQEAFRGTHFDVTGALEPGEANQVTVRVDHVPLPELFLGGIVEPVYLVEHGG